MDKFVVFVVLMVLSNHMVLFTHAFHPRTRLVFVEPMVGSASNNVVQFTAHGDVRGSKPQVLAQQSAAPPGQPPQPTNFKMQFIDSIFQIPIGALKAVNNLVQTIATGITTQVTTTTTTGSAASPLKTSVVLDSAAQSSSPVGVRGSGTSNSVRTETASRFGSEPAAAAAAAPSTPAAVSESTPAAAAASASSPAAAASTPVKAEAPANSNSGAPPSNNRGVTPSGMSTTQSQ